MEKEYKAIFGQAMSVVTHKPSQYAKNITLRYPMKSTFKGDKIRICLDNFTGKEGVVFDSITIGRVISGRDLDPTSIVDITFNGSKGLHLDVGEQCYSDPLEFKVHEPDEEKTLEETVASSLAQIEEKKYDAELINAGVKKENIRHYGFAFEGKKILIGTQE